MIWLQNSSYFLLLFLLSIVGTSVKYLFPMISLKYPLIKLRIFELHVSNAINKNTFVWLFISLDFIQIKIFNVYHVIEKVVCSIFYIYIFESITHFFNFIFLALLVFLLICYWCHDMEINVFVLLDILSGNSKYEQLSIMLWQLMKNLVKCRNLLKFFLLEQFLLEKFFLK